MTLLYPVDQENFALRTAPAQGQDPLVGWRAVPGAGGLAVRKGDHDQVVREASLQLLLLPAVDDVTPLEGCEGGVDCLEIGKEIFVHADVAQVRHGVARHGDGSLCLDQALQPVRWIISLARPPRRLPARS